MSEKIDPAPVPRNQLREEAAQWFAILRGPDGETRREEFNRWLARGALHRHAYNSVAETFNLGKALKDEAISDAQMTARRRVGLAKTMLSCGAAAVLLSAGWYGLSRHYSGLPLPGETQASALAFEARYATGIGEIRSFTLKDGSKLTLDTNSVVLASYTQGERALRLMAGRARFTAAPEARPFVVRVDTTLIRTKDTSFDVSLSGNRQVTVLSLQGLLDVQTQSDGAPEGTSPPAVTSLAAGQLVSTSPAQRPMRQAASSGEVQWIEGVRAFNDVPLADLVAETNRYAPRPILLANPATGRRHVSGTYRLKDTRLIAEKLASLLDLSMSERSDGFVLEQR